MIYDAKKMLFMSPIAAASGGLMSWRMDAKESHEDALSAEELFKVTKAEFRRLTRWQADIATPPAAAAAAAAASRDFDAGPPQWLHLESGADAVSYRKELEASAKAFCDRKWPQHETPAQPTPAAVGCRPPPWRAQLCSEPRQQSAPTSRASARPLTAVVRPSPRVQRPLTAVPNSRFADDVTYGTYDTLSPDVISALNARYGQRGGFDGHATAVAAKERAAASGDGPFTASQPAGGNHARLNDAVPAGLSPSASAVGPAVGHYTRLAGARGGCSTDRSRYDFEATSTEQPEYFFKALFTPAIASIDFCSAAERNENPFDGLTSGGGFEDAELKIAAKLLRLAKLQLATRREEDLRRENARWLNRRRALQLPQQQPPPPQSQTASSAPRGKMVSGIGRGCCADCLQPACVGDCPEKRKGWLGGSGGETSMSPYDAHARRYDGPSAAERPKTAAPAAAAPERPKSSSGLSTRRQTEAVAANSGTPPRSVAAAATLGTDEAAASVMARRCRSARLRGRDTVLPGKSFFSQRRRSLTGGSGGGGDDDGAVVKDAAPSVSRSRRARSAKS